MIRSLYSGVSGLRNHQVRMDVIGNNIANVNTTGFKAGRTNFQDLISQRIRNASDNGGGTTFGRNPAQVGLGVTVTGIQNLMDQGALQTTGRVLDLAVQGNGFFMAMDPVTTNIYYTRNGVMMLDKDGFLVNSEGYQILDQAAAPVQMPDAQIITIGKDGSVTYVDSTGASFNTDIGVANIENPESMEKVGGNLYRPTIATAGYVNLTTAINPGAPVAGATVESGYLEMSNVDLSDEFTNMITTQRGYQANARIITVSDSLLEELVNLKR